MTVTAWAVYTTTNLLTAFISRRKPNRSSRRSPDSGAWTCGVLASCFPAAALWRTVPLFEGVSLLPPGSIWTFRRGQAIRKETYFDKETWETLPHLSAEDYYQRLKETFIHVLPRYFAGSQRVGLSLTGGLDSRMIVAHAQHEPYKLQCYTFGGIYRDPADVKIARKIADVCQQYHETITIRNKFFTEFPSLARKTVYYTDGSCDVGGAAGFSVNRLAREIAPVRLTGNYGDEVLRGHNPFKADHPTRAFLPRNSCNMSRQRRLLLPACSTAAGRRSSRLSKCRGITTAECAWSSRK